MAKTQAEKDFDSYQDNKGSSYSWRQQEAANAKYTLQQAADATPPEPEACYWYAKCLADGIGIWGIIKGDIQQARQYLLKGVRTSQDILCLNELVTGGEHTTTAALFISEIEKVAGRARKQWFDLLQPLAEKHKVYKIALAYYYVKGYGVKKSPQQAYTLATTIKCFTKPTTDAQHLLNKVVIDLKIMLPCTKKGLTPQPVCDETIRFLNQIKDINNDYQDPKKRPQFDEFYVRILLAVARGQHFEKQDVNGAIQKLQGLSKTYWPAFVAIAELRAEHFPYDATLELAKAIDKIKDQQQFSEKELEYIRQTDELLVVLSEKFSGGTAERNTVLETRGLLHGKAYSIRELKQGATTKQLFTFTQAREYLEAITDESLSTQRVAELLLAEGLRLEQAQNYPGALTHFREASEKGNIQAKGKYIHALKNNYGEQSDRELHEAYSSRSVQLHRQELHRLFQEVREHLNTLSSLQFDNDGNITKAANTAQHWADLYNDLRSELYYRELLAHSGQQDFPTARDFLRQLTDLAKSHDKARLQLGQYHAMVQQGGLPELSHGKAEAAETPAPTHRQQALALFDDTLTRPARAAIRQSAMNNILRQYRDFDASDLFALVYNQYAKYANEFINQIRQRSAGRTDLPFTEKVYAILLHERFDARQLVLSSLEDAVVLTVELQKVSQLLLATPEQPAIQKPLRSTYLPHLLQLLLYFQKAYVTEESALNINGLVHDSGTSLQADVKQQETKSDSYSDVRVIDLSAGKAVSSKQDITTTQPAAMPIRTVAELVDTVGTLITSTKQALQELEINTQALEKHIASLQLVSAPKP